MAAKLPKVINVGALQYKIEYKDRPLNCDNRPIYGEVSYIDKRITIDGAAGTSRIKYTLIHEMFHVIEELYGKPAADSDIDEGPDRSSRMADILMANPDLLRYIIER